ncbi:hypothetical protein LOK49_Contig71G00011 [Camellia lanceoleosa]|nr:hypothetical protein LOK49_Contig71G00011 [Camellia lanceoleosa]
MDEEVNSHAKGFRKKGMVYYHELSRILGDTSATGKLAHSSTKSPSESSASSDLEFKVKNEDLDALQIDSDNDNGDGQGKGKGKSKIAVGDDSGSIEGGSTASRSLLKECMALLHAMEEIPAPAYTKTVNKLASNPIKREVFVDMPAGETLFTEWANPDRIVEDVGPSGGGNGSSTHAGSSSQQPIDVDISQPQLRHMSDVRNQIASQIWESVRNN